MKKLKSDKRFINISLLLILLNINFLISANETESNLFITGYLSLNGELINNLRVFSELKNDKGINLAEASFLSTYKYDNDITFNSVFTYKPRLDWNSIIAELCASYEISESLNLKVGRFLMPINPINAHYYAATNVGIALPSFVTNHKLFPLNINGLDINGIKELSDNFKINYNLIGGQYYKKSQSEDGVLGFFGREGIFMTDNLDSVGNKLRKLDSAKIYDYPMFSGIASRVSFDIGSNFNIGFGGFWGDETKESELKSGGMIKADINFLSYGTDLTFDYQNFNLKTSIWFGYEKSDDEVKFLSKNFYNYAGEISYILFEKLTPYLKLEVINGMSKENRIRIIDGINYRPRYEMAFKIEHIRYIQTFIDDFDVYQFSCVFSF